MEESIEYSREYKLLAENKNSPQKKGSGSFNSNAEFVKLLISSYILICDYAVTFNTQDAIIEESSAFLLGAITQGAKDSDETCLNILAHTLAGVSKPATAVKIIRFFKEDLSGEELNGKLLAKIHGIAVGKGNGKSSSQNDLKLDLDNSNNSVTACIKELINISVLNDESSKKFAALTTEPSFIGVRSGVAHDVLVRKHMKPRSPFATDAKNSLRPEILPYFIECAGKYLETTRRNSDFSNVKVMPATYRDSCIQLVINLIKLNGHSRRYIKSSKRQITLNSTDGKTVPIEIPYIVIGSVWNFFDLVTLSSFIESSQQLFRQNVLEKNFKKERDEIQQQMMVRLFSFEKIQESLSDLVYDTSFLAQLLLTIKINTLKKNLEDLFKIDNESDFENLRKDIITKFEKHGLNFKDSETLSREDFAKIQGDLEEVIGSLLKKRIGWYFRRQGENTISTDLQKALFSIKVSQDDVFTVLNCVRNNNFNDIFKIEREKYGLLYQQSDAKKSIDNEFNRIFVLNIKNFLKKFSGLDASESELKKALTEGLEVFKKNNAEKELKEYKNIIDSAIMEYEAREVAETLQAKLTNKDFLQLIEKLAHWQDQGLSNKQIGELLYDIVQQLGLEGLFNRSLLQRFAINAGKALLWVLARKIGEKAKGLKPNELLQQIDGLSTMPPVNLWYSLKQLFEAINNYEAVNKLTGNLRETIVNPLNHKRHQFFYAVKTFINELPGEIVEKELCKYFAVSKETWSSNYAKLVKVLNSNDVMNRFDELFEDSFRKYCCEVAHLSFMYNTYHPFFTLVLFSLFYSRFTKEDATEIIEFCDTYLQAVLESATLSAASFLRSSLRERPDYKYQEDDSVYMKCLNMISALGAKDKLFPPAENMPDSYYEALALVFERMLSTCKFDPKDNRYQFLVQHCGVGKKQAVKEALKDEALEDEEKVHLSDFVCDTVDWKIKNFFLSPNPVPAEKFLPLGLNLAIYKSDPKMAKRFILNHCRLEKNRFPLMAIVNVFRRHQQMSVNADDLWKAIDKSDLSKLQEILSNAKPFAISIMAVKEDAQKDTNPISYAYSKVRAILDKLSLEEDDSPKKKKPDQQIVQELEERRMIVKTLLDFCSENDELIAILTALGNPSIVDDKEMKKLFRKATKEMRSTLSTETSKQKIGAFITKLFGRKPVENSTGSTDSATDGSSANSPTLHTKKVEETTSSPKKREEQAENMSLRGFFNKAESKSRFERDSIPVKTKISDEPPKKVDEVSNSEKHSKQEADSNIPEEYLCPINLTLMEKPYICSLDERTYEYAAIKSWLEKKRTAPFTREALKETQSADDVLTRNKALEDLIEKFNTNNNSSTLGAK